MTDQSTPEVSQAIRAQLGGALAMLGAKDLMRTADSLSFRIRGSKLANHITLTLDAGADEYVVRFCKIARRPSYAITRDHSFRVYADGLHDLIETHTGLYTRL